MRFCDIGIKDDRIVGKNISILDLFDKRILIEKTRIEATKFPGKNTSGLRMQMQIVLAEFTAATDDMGDYFVKDDRGVAVGERRSCFTGSDSLINAIKASELRMQDINRERKAVGEDDIDMYPIDTTIVKVGQCFHFT